MKCLGQSITLILTSLAVSGLTSAQIVEDLPQPGEQIILSAPTGAPGVKYSDPILLAPEVANDDDFNAEGIQHLTRGPVHEAFATQVTTDAAHNPLVIKAPPAAINELPPKLRPDGQEVIWISGYWAWDEDRNDYLWVSGVWRVPPQGRSWVAGSWTEVSDEHNNLLGHRWVSGYWSDGQRQVVQYVTPPPESLEVGPSHPADNNDQFWMPGNWLFEDDAYFWQPGSWCEHRPEMVWIPAHYVHTPRGCVFVSGYWDYQLIDRGQLFTPVSIQPHVVARPDFCYQPDYVVNVPSLPMHLFVCPTRHHYYFGDYYEPRYSQLYHSHAHYHSRGFGYDPLFVHYNHYYRGRGVDYGRQLSRWNIHFTVNLNSRPSRTLYQHQQWLNRRGPSAAPYLVLTRSLQDQIVRDRNRNNRPNPGRPTRAPSPTFVKTRGLENPRSPVKQTIIRPGTTRNDRNRPGNNQVIVRGSSNPIGSNRVDSNRLDANRIGRNSTLNDVRRNLLSSANVSGKPRKPEKAETVVGKPRGGRTPVKVNNNKPLVLNSRKPTPANKLNSASRRDITRKSRTTKPSPRTSVTTSARTRTLNASRPTNPTPRRSSIASSPRPAPTPTRTRSVATNRPKPTVSRSKPTVVSRPKPTVSRTKPKPATVSRPKPTVTRSKPTPRPTVSRPKSKPTPRASKPASSRSNPSRASMNSRNRGKAGFRSPGSKR